VSGVGDTEDMQLARTCGSGWVPRSASSQASNYVRRIRRPRGDWGAMLALAWRTKRRDGELLLLGFGVYWH
jgi:hypothetical protein